MQHQFTRFLFLTCLLTFSVQFTNAQVYYGGGLSYNSNPDYKALGITGKIGFGIAEKIDLNTDIIYYIDSKASWSFNFDAHYKLVNLSDVLEVNPFAGINFTRTDITNNSLNLGISFRAITEQYTYFIDPRWILDNRQFVLTIGVLF